MNVTKIVIAGGGALGSQIAHNIARQGLEVHVIDDDKIEVNNIHVSVFNQTHLGKNKSDVVSDIVNNRGGIGVSHVTTLESKEQILDLEPDIVIDCFDNLEARAITTGLGVPTLHVGVGKEGNGIAYWDGDYHIPDGNYKRGDNPVCTNALGAPILRRTALRASELFDMWYANNKQSSDIVSVEGSF